MRTVLRHLTTTIFALGALAPTTLPAVAQPTAQAAQRADTTLALPPRDTAVTIGTLPNGLTYYIRNNREPERRVELRLVVKVGSLQEDDDQQGLAHFLEHMAFNGTKNFKGQDLVKYLESIGMRFGGDLNASTSYDRTIYMLTVPTDKDGALATGFQILDDWAQAISFDPQDVKDERGVVLGEWRARLGAGSRIRIHTDSILLGKSRYLDRQPIGLPERIENATREQLLRYYRDWYRPDLMAVVVVGDIDKAQIEGLIKQHFGDLTSPKKKRARKDYTIPTHAQPLVSVVTDPELTGTKIELVQKFAPEPRNTVARSKASITQSLFSAILNKRLHDIATKSNAPFLGAGTGFGDFVGGMHVHTVMGVNLRDDAIIPGFKAALMEVERIAQHGVTDEELDREKRSAKAGYTQSLITRSKITSASYANAYVNTYVDGGNPVAVEDRVAFSRALLESITKEDVAALARKWKRRDNLALVAMLPQKEGLVPPTTSELLAVLDEVSKAQLAAERAEESVASTRELMPTLPTPGKVVAESTIAEIGATQWELANGAKVILKPTEFTPDQILLTGYGWGGTSVLADGEPLRDAVLARSLPALAGLGDFSATDLRNALVGRLLSAGMGIGRFNQSVSGNSTARDLETLFQLIHLHFTSPRLDTEAIESWKQRTKTAIEGRIASPEAHFADSLGAILSQGHPRNRHLTPAAIDSINPENALAIYRERFADAGDFTFVLVGDFKVDSVRPLVELYLASLPSQPSSRGWKDDGVRSPQGVIEKEFRMGREPRARTTFVYTGPFAHSESEQVGLGAMTNILGTRLRERLRESLGGTYSVNVGAGLQSIPTRTYSVQITFDAAPERVDEMRRAVVDEIEKLRKSGPTKAELSKVLEEYSRQTELSLKDNRFWLQMIAAYDQMERPLAELANYSDLFKVLNPSLLQEMAKRYLDPTRVVRVTQLPTQ